MTEIFCDSFCSWRFVFYWKENEDTNRQVIGFVFLPMNPILICLLRHQNYITSEGKSAYKNHACANRDFKIIARKSIVSPILSPVLSPVWLDCHKTFNKSSSKIVQTTLSDFNSTFEQSCEKSNGSIIPNRSQNAANSQ